MMDKLEKVIKAFEFCLMSPSEKEIADDICSHEDCPYYREYNGGKCISAAVSDALALLKAQEPVKPLILVKDAALSNGTKYLCGKCGGSFFHQKVNFCPWCGQAVKWE